MKKILTILLLASFTLASVSCDKYLDVNNNVDAPDYVEAPLYLAGVLSAWQGTYWDGRALTSLANMHGTYGGYSSYANHYHYYAGDYAAEMFRVTYWLQGVNLENMIKQAEADEAWTLAGIGYAVKAFSWDFVTKMHGDLPMSQTFQPGVLEFQYDYQPVIFEQVRAWANKALEYLEMPDNAPYAEQVKANDLIYGGDKDKWIKFTHAVIARNLSALTNKSDFQSKYAQELLKHASLAMQSNADNATMATEGGGDEAQFSAYNNSWGVYRGLGSDGMYASDFAVQVMTGTMPVYDETTGDKIAADVKEGETDVDPDFPFRLAEVQYVADTSDVTGHFDPRVTAKISTLDARKYKDMSNIDSIKSWVYYGGGFTSNVGPIGDAPNVWGSRSGYNSSTSIDGDGRWLYRNNAPYIFITAAEIQFIIAETQFKLGNKAEALAAFKKGIELDLEFTAQYLYPGKPKVSGKDEDGNDIYEIYGELPGGDVITVATFNQLAKEYKEGPYVAGMTESQLTMSHIMLQKFVALYPWGANETWVDMRKNHYDIKYSGEYPSLNNGWTQTTVDQKWDSDPTKVYKGLYLKPAQVEDRRGTWNVDNEGAPCYRIHPRYNSEYMWNEAALKQLKPISGTAKNYHTSIPWFAYPGEYPEN